MPVRASVDGLAAALQSAADDVFQVMDDEVQAGSDGLKAELREATEAVLGSRVALTWRNRFYSNKGTSSGPAGFVWSKAPRIISFFSAERVVTPVGKAFAIPVARVVGSRGRRATVAEVQARFGRLIYKPFRDGNAGLFADLSRSRGRGSKGKGGKPQLTLMFVLVRSLRSAKLIDLDEIAQRWGERIADNIRRRVGS